MLHGVPVVDAHCHVSPVWYEPVETLLFQMERNGVDTAILIQMLPGADVARAVYVIAGYAIVFGVVVMLAARAFRREYITRPRLRAHHRAA